MSAAAIAASKSCKAEDGLCKAAKSWEIFTLLETTFDFAIVAKI